MLERIHWVRALIYCTARCTASSLWDWEYHHSKHFLCALVHMRDPRWERLVGPLNNFLVPEIGSYKSLSAFLAMLLFNDVLSWHVLQIDLGLHAKQVLFCRAGSLASGARSSVNGVRLLTWNFETAFSSLDFPLLSAEGSAVWLAPFSVYTLEPPVLKLVHL